MSTEQPTMPPGPRELLAVWDDWSAGDVNRRAAAKAEANGNAEGAALLARSGDRAGHATALEALAAAAELVRRMEGTRWLAMRDAREQGATWQQIGDAIGLTRQRALGIYQEALDKQERYVPDLHVPHAAAARAVAGDDAPPADTPQEPTAPGVEATGRTGLRWRRGEDGLWQDVHGHLKPRPWEVLWDVYGPLTPAGSALRSASNALELDPDDREALARVGAIVVIVGRRDDLDPRALSARALPAGSAQLAVSVGEDLAADVPVILMSVGPRLADELRLGDDPRRMTIAGLPGPLRASAAAAWAQHAETS